MAEQTMRGDFDDAKRHAKDAVRASLMAVRSAVDFVLEKLDGEPAKEPAPGGTPRDEAPPPSHDDA
jgi:hypothetical protein